MPSKTLDIQPHAQADDAALIALACQGKERAFRELVNRYAGLVFNFIYRMTHNPETSEEITQEVFVKVYQNLGSFDQSRPFRPWVLRIASNTALSELRRQSRRSAQTTSLTTLEENGFSIENHPAPEPGERDEVSTALEQQEALALLQQGLDALDPKYRQALILRYQQELSYEEVAQALDIPLNTVRTWIRRGLDKLRLQVKELQS